MLSFVGNSAYILRISASVSSEFSPLYHCLAVYIFSCCFFCFFMLSSYVYWGIFQVISSDNGFSNPLFMWLFSGFHVNGSHSCTQSTSSLNFLFWIWEPATVSAELLLRVQCFQQIPTGASLERWCQTVESLPKLTMVMSCLMCGWMHRCMGFSCEYLLPSPSCSSCAFSREMEGVRHPQRQASKGNACHYTVCWSRYVCQHAKLHCSKSVRRPQSGAD